MSRAVFVSALIVIGTFKLVPDSKAHADLEEQIGSLTKKLADQAATPELYLQRADLYRRHAQFDEALRDIAAAAERKGNSTEITLARAKVFGDAGRAEEALDAVQQFLATETNHWQGFIIRARAYRQLKQPHDALPDYNRAIATAPAPGPDLFLERAEMHVALTNLDAAIRGLDEGIAQAGALPSLELRAIEYERQRKTFDAAVARVDRITARYPVKEPTLALRGEIFEQAGRVADARESFNEVLAGINAYPAFRRDLDLTKKLETRARAGLARLESQLSPPANPSLTNVHSALKLTP